MTNTTTAKHYAKRDPEAQGTHYENHVYAMTTEGLHAKSAIAAELAHRDIEIERLRVAFAAPAQAVAPTDIITASIMHDDGGEHPAFCLMVAYRAEKDAKAALAILADAPCRQGDMRKYVEAFAAKSGWNPGSGEGAFEYVQRICYSQGFEDATVQSQRKTHAAPRWQAAARKPLADEVLHALYAEVMTGHYANALHYWIGTHGHRFARAIEQAHGIKATNQESNK